MRILLILWCCSLSLTLFAQNAPLGKGCKQVNTAYLIILEAIEVGAPTYNNGNHVGCYKIYEGAAYKILYLYGNKCKVIRKRLETALIKVAEGEYKAGEKAWIMRMAFDDILGVPTKTSEPLKRS